MKVLKMLKMFVFGLFFNFFKLFFTALKNFKGFLFFSEKDGFLRFFIIFGRFFTSMSQTTPTFNLQYIFFHDKMIHLD